MEAVLATKNVKKMKMDQIQVIEKLFHPESIAIIGASGDKHKLGYQLVRGFVEMGYSGKLPR